MRAAPSVDVFLFPAVVGGGLGDIEEVLAAGRRLAEAGFRIRLYRAPGRPLPRGVEGPWDWPRHRRVDRLRPRGAAALTVSPSFGVSAAPSRPERFGRGGPWEAEAAAVEAAYGPDRTLHVSLEEFARTLTSAEETRERFREGGTRSRAIGRVLRRARAAREVEAFRAAFVRFRAFDRPNVLHLFTTFAPNRRFAREFPAAVQTGPLWPGHRARPERSRKRAARREWVWYASPSSAERIAAVVAHGLAGERPPIRLFVRSPRPWGAVDTLRGVTVVSRPIAPSAWRARCARAELRIVTGSRTLLEAIELGGPFLYFNGILGTGSHSRRHRPEKLRALLALSRRGGLAADVRRDLADFARGRRIARAVRRAARRAGGWSRFRVPRDRRAFRPPFDDAGALLVAVGRALGRPRADAPEIVRRVRAGSNP
jgi:hypothetical protein